MGVSDRALYLLIGCFIGFILGYIVRSLQVIKQKLSEKDNDDGLVRYPLVLDVALLIVVGLTVFAAFRAQVAANKSDDVTDALKSSNVVACQNANETRTANKQLWDFIISVSVSSPGNRNSPKALKFLHEIQHWIDDIYRLHDCNDLDKKYPIPPPPAIVHFPDKHKHR